MTGMLPTHQGLGANQTFILKAVFGLVINDQLALLQGLLNFTAQLDLIYILSLINIRYITFIASLAEFCIARLYFFIDFYFEIIFSVKHINASPQANKIKKFLIIIIAEYEK